MSDSIILAQRLRFSWDNHRDILDINRFEVASGQRVFLKGPSGSGKSTLLGLIGGVLHHQVGDLTVCGQNMKQLSGSARDRLRADRMGVIFQMFNLVPYLSVSENVALPSRFSKRRRERIDAQGGIASEVSRLLDRLGLNDRRLHKRPVTELSVGQQQRVAAARALIGSPDLILADEPTSALDADAREQFITLLNEEVEASGAAMVFVSHDAALAPLFDTALDLTQLNAPRLMASA